MPNLINYFKVRQYIKPLETLTVDLVKVDVESMLVDRCTISGVTGSPRAFAVIATNEPCQVQDMSEDGDPGSAELFQKYAIKKIRVAVTRSLELGWLITHAGTVYEIYSFAQDATPNVFNSALMKTAHKK